MSYDPELEAFKTQIDLRQYAASLGFEYDKVTQCACLKSIPATVNAS
jgi:hypothetical protein